MSVPEKVYPFKLPEDGLVLSAWMREYGREVSEDEVNRYLHFKNQEYPKSEFILWTNVLLMGSYAGWILVDVYSIRTLWHSVNKSGQKLVGTWWAIRRPLAMPYTEAPVY